MALAATIVRIIPNVILETVYNVIVRLNILNLPFAVRAPAAARFLVRAIIGDHTLSPGIQGDQSSALAAQSESEI